MSPPRMPWASRVRQQEPPALPPVTHAAPIGAGSLDELLGGGAAATVGLPVPVTAPQRLATVPATAPGAYQALELMRTGDAAMALVVKTFNPRMQTPERYLMPYPQLLHVYALGDNSVTLQFASMAFSVQGPGIVDPILEAINERSLKGLQQFHAARWPAPAGDALRIDAIVAIDPQQMMQGQGAENGRQLA